VQVLTKGDLKFLASGVAGACLVAVIVFAAYQGWQRAHRQSGLEESRLVSQEEQERAIESINIRSTEPLVPPQEQQKAIESINLKASGAGSAAVSEEDQKKAQEAIMAR